MHEFFRSGKRKFGVVTLLIACGFMGIWIRSLGNIDRFRLHPRTLTHELFASCRASLIWLHAFPVDPTQWSGESNKLASELFLEYAEGHAEYSLGKFLENEPPFTWRFRFCGFDVGERSATTSMGDLKITIWKLPYWSIVMPLTLLAGWLLLSKPTGVSLPGSTPQLSN